MSDSNWRTDYKLYIYIYTSPAFFSPPRRKNWGQLPEVSRSVDISPSESYQFPRGEFKFKSIDRTFEATELDVPAIIKEKNRRNFLFPFFFFFFFFCWKRNFIFIVKQVDNLYVGISLFLRWHTLPHPRKFVKYDSNYHSRDSSFLFSIFTIHKNFYGWPNIFSFVNLATTASALIRVGVVLLLLQLNHGVCNVPFFFFFFCKKVLPVYCVAFRKFFKGHREIEKFVKRSLHFFLCQGARFYFYSAKDNYSQRERERERKRESEASKKFLHVVPLIETNRDTHFVTSISPIFLVFSIGRHLALTFYADKRCLCHYGCQYSASKAESLSVW